ALDESLENLFAMKCRYDQHFSVVIFDIDHFKRINDEHGHLTGDKVLRNIASILDGEARETDLVCRYGGEEFVVVMPQTDLRSAGIFCHRVRHSIEKAPILNINLTISGGIAEALEGENAQSLLSRSDQALYQAKAAGRDCLWCHNGVDCELMPDVVAAAQAV